MARSGDEEPAITAASASHAGEHVMAAFGRLDMDPVKMTVRDCALADLAREAMPCVVVLEGHCGIALLRALDENRFEALTGHGKTILTLDDMAARYTGRVLAPAIAGQKRASGAAECLPMPSQAEANMSALVRRIVLSVFCAPSFGLMIVAAVTANLFVFALPIYSMAVYDRIIPHRATETLIALTLGIVIVLGIDLFCRNMRGRLQEAIGIRTSLDLQWSLFQRVLKADFVQAPRSAGLLQSAFGAVESACILSPGLVAGILVDVPFLILTLLYTAFIAQWVVIPPVLTIIAIVAVNFIAHARARKAHAGSSRGLIERQNLLEETVQGLAVVKGVGAQPQVSARYGALIDDMSYHGYEARHEIARAGQIANTLLQLCTVASLVIGAFLINAGSMTVGALVAAVLLTSRAIAPITMLAAQAVRAASLASSLQYAALLDKLPQEEAGDAEATPAALSGDIRLASVSLRYPGEPKPALNGVSLSISAGERVGIIGRIGCGKSSLIQMLPRLLTPENGTILIDEHDIRQYDPVWLRRNIAYMPQDCELIDGTIRDNILRGLPEVDEALFREVAHISGVKEIVASHPKGYALEVGRRTRQLSGGERQAVCLARTLVRDAPVLVLDEPTSSMDNQLEGAVVGRLRDFVKGRTVVIATHRAPLLALVDRVIWLDEGRILADGPRDEVISRVHRQAA